MPPTEGRRNGDYYDIYILTKLQYSNIDIGTLKTALDATVEKRGSKMVLKDYHKIMDIVKNSGIMQKQWDNYRKDYEYAADIAFVDVCNTIEQLMDNLMER